MNFEIEEITDEDKLFRHFPKSFIENEKLTVEAFIPQGEDLSVFWEKYCADAATCLSLAGKTQLTHGAGHFVTAEVRNHNFIVRHSATSNQAHASIDGITRRPRGNFLQMRKILQSIFIVDI